MADKASSVWPEMPFMRGPVGAQRLREWLPVQRDIRARTAKRRERVLAYGWACKRLCLILDLDDARQWGGYVPSYADDGPIRQALMKLLHDVAAADNGGATGQGGEVGE